MSIVLNTVDQVPGSRTVEGPSLRFKVGRITARDIICARVYDEVERYNKAEAPATFIGLVVPAPDERELNSPQRQRRPLDPAAQIDAALGAFKARRVILLFNGEQVTDLDEPLLVTPVSEARFLKLVPLVGG